MSYELVPLGELGEIVAGSTPDTYNKKYWGGDIAWITPADLTNHEGIYFTGELRKITEAGYKSCSTKMLPVGSILFSSRAPIGHCAVTSFPLCTNQGFKSIIPNERLDSVYGFFALKFFTPQIEALGRGATFAEVNKEIFENYRIPLPPLTEQKRIVSLLARADRLRQLRRTAHDLGDALLQSVFLEMFGDVDYSKWDKSELGELIEGFEAGINYLPVGEGENTSDWRVLKISAVTWGDFDPTESKPISADVKFAETHIVRQGDLLISRANTTELVGAVSLVKIIPPKVLLPDKLWRVKFRKDSAILQEYTLHVLRQPGLRKIIGDLATGSSGSMKNISMEKAATLPIPVPPLGLQEEFAGVVARVEGLRGRMSEAGRQVEGLFEGLLAEAFA